MKAFSDKYVVCHRDDDGCATVRIFEIDRRRNKIPKFFDSAADAVIEIGEKFILTGNEVKKNHIVEDALNECFGLFIAHAEMDKEGNVYIYSAADYEDEVIYDGHYNGLVK